MAGASGACNGVGAAMPRALTRALRGVSPAHLGQHRRHMVPPMQAIRDLAGEGRPKARRCRLRLRAIPHVHLAPAMRLTPLRHGLGFPVGEESQGLPPFQGHEAGARGRALPQREVVHAEALRGDDRRAGGATAQPQRGVPTPRATSRRAQAHPRRPAARERHGEEARRQPPRASRPRRHKARQSLGENATWALRIRAEELTDAKLPGDGLATPGAIGERPGVMTRGTPCRDVTSRAAGFGWCGREAEGDPGVHVVEGPGV